MSRTKKGSKGPGYEHWKSRLKRQGDQPGKKTKVVTHQRERAIAKRDLKKEENHGEGIGMTPKTHITQMDIWAGPERIAEWLPKREDIPKEFWGENKYTEIIHKWFFSGAGDVVFVAKEGIDKSHALAHIKSCLMSFDPPHEWKVAGCAYLLSLWFEV